MPIVFIFIALLSTLDFYASEHTTDGTNYGEKGVSTYAQTKHGPDGVLFLDPYFIPFLENLNGQILLDAGCGAGPWSIYAAKNGAFVYGIDIQSGMIEKAQKTALEQHVEDHTHFIVGDVNDLPYQENLFDRAISINVGCNLPQLKLHLAELSRVLKPGGIAIITAPTSFGIVFTDSQTADDEVVKAIHLLLNQQADFPQNLQHLDNVYRATFAKQNDQWTLVSDESLLTSGEKIWRKIPKMVVPNYYHSADEYEALFCETGLDIIQSYQPSFKNQSDLNDYNATAEEKLGNAYVQHSPFIIFVVQKS